MSRTYLPNSKQIKKINEHLKTIAGAMGMEANVSTWKDVQKIVETGSAPRFFPVGHQFIVPHSIYGDIVFDVVAHDYLKSSKNPNTHTMTILSHDVLNDFIRFDAPEAFYVSTSDLPPGDYYFKIKSDYNAWQKGSYYFTVEDYIDENTQLVISRVGNGDLVSSAKVTGYFVDEGMTKYTEFEVFQADIKAGEQGSYIGTLGEDLNHVHRVYAGSNNYAESAVRQFLNSSAPRGEVWLPSNKYDRPPEWADTTDGFEHGLDSEFLSIVGEVSLPCSRNNTFETANFTAKKTYTLTTDKFYLPSQMEIFGHSDGINPDESILFPYFKDAISADRVKHTLHATAALSWSTRSAYAISATGVRTIMSDGSISISSTPTTIAIACTIVGNV